MLSVAVRRYAVHIPEYLVFIDWKIHTGSAGQVYTSDDEVEIAVAYFNAHYSEHIVIEEYAASRNISKGWFIRLFRLRMGMTPVQYLSSVRLTYAQTMLEQSDYNISRIAASVGYDNALYFTRRFTKSLGMSPTEYRKKYGIHNQINVKQNFDMDE